MQTQTLALPVLARRFTFDEFVDFVEYRDERYELENGYLFEMPYSSIRHADVASNLTKSLIIAMHLNHLYDYKLYQDTMAFRPPGEDSYYFSDIVITPQAVILERVPEKIAYTNHPAVLIEVLSKSTQRRDKGIKQDAYLAYSSLENYMMVSQSEHKVEVWNRDEREEWLLHTYTNPSDEISLLGRKIQLKLADIYKNVL